ncbi:MAG: hypothetical protein AAF125_16480, partial [Chloroflexota bacterium]
MPSYTIQTLKTNLIYIRWTDTPQIGSQEESAFITELQSLLDGAPAPLYLLSDLRHGKIRNAKALRQLGELTSHKNMAGSTAFTSDPVTKLMVGVFEQYARQMRRSMQNQTWETPEKAIAYLEQL